MSKENFWDKCRETTAMVAARDAERARRVAVAAREIGAEPDPNTPGGWRVTCPHCGAKCAIAANGHVTHGHPTKNCAAANKLQAYLIPIDPALSRPPGRVR